MRIALVNDSPMALEALRRVVKQSPDHNIAWEAQNGQEAVGACQRDVPDLILMDLIMPVMNGVEATKLIMDDSPCSILVVTATVEGNASFVFEAMRHGALDAVETPTIGENGEIDGSTALIKKIEMFSHLHQKSSRAPEIIETGGPQHAARSAPLVVIGSSTGGPTALASIISSLPEDFQGAVSIVQHIERGFVAGLAKWLSDHSHLEAKVAEKGDLFVKRKVLVSSSSEHLVLTPHGLLDYIPNNPNVHIYCPSVDLFFESVAENWPMPGVAILLSGMGKDGAKGMLALRSKGWYTIAQDKDSSAIYGMPKEAVKLNAAVISADVKDIPSIITSRCRAQVEEVNGQ